jgi:hypothetical protein
MDPLDRGWSKVGVSKNPYKIIENILKNVQPMWLFFADTNTLNKYNPKNTFLQKRHSQESHEILY